jgi:hypothetical protein
MWKRFSGAECDNTYEHKLSFFRGAHCCFFSRMGSLPASSSAISKITCSGHAVENDNGDHHHGGRHHRHNHNRDDHPIITTTTTPATTMEMGG